MEVVDDRINKQESEEWATRSSNSKRSRTDSGRAISTLQGNFKKEVEARDKVCVVSGEEVGLEAAHIVAHHGGSGTVEHLFSQIEFKDNSGEVISDIWSKHNGMLLKSTLHYAFDKKKWVFFSGRMRCVLYYIS